MTQLRTAWRRAVTAAVGPIAGGPGLADLLAFLGPAAAESDWTCDAVETRGPLADELRREAEAGPIPGHRLAKLAVGITHVSDGTFEASRPGEDRPWLSLRAGDGGPFVVATRSRALLDDLRHRFRDHAP